VTNRNLFYLSFIIMMIIEELIKTAQEIKETIERGEESGLSDAEIAFYDALADNRSAGEVLGDEQLRLIAGELVVAIRKNASIDWSLKESVRAKMRVIVRRILRKYGYPPDMQEDATKLVLMQAERICGIIAAD